MSSQNINSVISIMPVEDFEEASEWYAKLLGRGPDVVPMPGIAEWQLVENAWIQVTVGPEPAGGATVVVGVNDLEAQSKTCESVNIPMSEIVEYPEVIKMAEITDPAGNKISFVQDISNGADA